MLSRLTTVLAVGAVSAMAAQQIPPSGVNLQALRNRIAASSNEDDRANAAYDLAEADGNRSIGFLVQRFRQEPSADVKIAILNALAELDSEEVRTALADAGNDPNARVAAVAQVRLGEQNAHEMERRIALMSRADRGRSAALAQDAVTLGNILRVGKFPEELRIPPPVFPIDVPASEIRFVALGDFGSGEKEQTLVADAIARQHLKTPFQFGITVGDNFYPKGLCGFKNDGWRLRWHDRYDALKILFYASLGNHDWDGVDESKNHCAAITEIQYSEEKDNPSWRMPRTHYTYTAGVAQFFVLDTDEKRSPQQPQRDWLARELKASNRRWKIVYGHHPIYSGGESHGSSSWLKMHNDILQARDTEADLFIAGHDHDLQHLKEKNLHYLGVGGGGREAIWNTKCLPQSLFARKTYGFAAIRATEAELEMSLVSTDGKALQSCTVTKKVLPDGTIQRTDNCKRSCKQRG